MERDPPDPGHQRGRSLGPRGSTSGTGRGRSSGNSHGRGLAASEGQGQERGRGPRVRGGGRGATRIAHASAYVDYHVVDPQAEHDHTQPQA